MATNQTTVFNQGIKQFLRPTSATSVTWTPYKAFLASQYTINSVAGANPSANGHMSVDSSAANNVAFIEYYDVQNGGTNNGAFLNAIKRGATIRVLQTGGTADEYYRVLYVSDQGSYVNIQVVWESGANGTFLVSSTTVSYIYTDYEYELNHGYNLITVTNDSSSNPLGNTFRMKMPSDMEAGEELVVEILAGSGTLSNVIPSYIYCLNDPSGLLISDFADQYALYVPNGTSTNALLTLDSNDRAVMKFLSWYNSSTQNGLIPLGALQVING